MGNPAEPLPVEPVAVPSRASPGGSVCLVAVPTERRLCGKLTRQGTGTWVLGQEPFSLQFARVAAVLMGVLLGSRPYGPLACASGRLPALNLCTAWAPPFLSHSALGSGFVGAPQGAVLERGAGRSLPFPAAGDGVV